jgi:hypothetical protein
LSSPVADTFNNLAWLLAICPDTKLRDGKKAVEYARKACEVSKWKDPFHLGTYAAACAEAGDFDEAVKWQRTSLASGLPDSDMESARQRLELYEQKKPFHQEQSEGKDKSKRPARRGGKSVLFRKNNS